MAIKQLIPEYEPFQVRPRETREDGPFNCQSPHGLYHAVVMLTREEFDFKRLEKPDLDTARSGTAPPGSGLSDLIEQLSEYSDFRLPKTRGLRIRPSKSSETSWHAEIISWRTTR